MKPLLVLCLGNEVLSDDGFAWVIERRLAERNSEAGEVEIVFASTAGFALLDLLRERSSVLIVDTILTGTTPPGTLHQFPAGQFTPSRSLTTSHQMSLPTALEFGRLLGMEMPTDIEVLAVEALDTQTLRQALTPAVAAAVDPALLHIEAWIARKAASALAPA